jgi:hypothetical protein
MKVYAHFIEDKKNDVQELARSIFSGRIEVVDVKGKTNG